MPASKERKYRQNGGMFFLVNGKDSKEYDDMDTEEMYAMFKLMMGSATSIRMLSEFSLYGFVIEVFIDPNPMGRIKIMRQTRNVTGDPSTPKTAGKRERAQQLTSFCLKIVGIGKGSRTYFSLDGTKMKNKSLATFVECDTEVVVTRHVWGEMAKHNCVEVVPDAGFGFDLHYSEFEKLFQRFITPLDVSSHVIEWIIGNFNDIHLTVMEMASGCDTLSAYIERMERPATRSIAQESIKNASMEIIAYLIAMWIRTGITTTDGHSKNVMVNATGPKIGVHKAFIIYLLDLGRIFNRKHDSGNVIKPHFLKICNSTKYSNTALRSALHIHFNCVKPIPTSPDPITAFLGCDSLSDELTAKFCENLSEISKFEILSLTPAGLNIDQVERAFKNAVTTDIIVNASNYGHDYPQCVTVLERVFGIKFTNVSFLEHPFDTPADRAIFGKILLDVNRLLLPCRPGEVTSSLRVVPVPARPRASVGSPRVFPVNPLTDNVGDVVEIVVGDGIVSAVVVPDDSESPPDGAPAAAVNRSSSSSSSSSSLSSSPLSDAAEAVSQLSKRHRNETSPTPFFPPDYYGGSRKNRHKIRRGIKRSYSRSKHLRRSRNEKRRIRTTCRKYRRN
jgi:hypothetical protein